MIYAAQATTGGPIKIGCSANIPTRIRQLEAHYGQPLALLATLPGGPEEERAIHRRFTHLRFGRTEQFRPAADLMGFLGRPLLVGANPEAVELLEAPHYIRVSDKLADLLRKLRGQTGLSAADLLNDCFLPELERIYANLIERELSALSRDPS